jgi:hypothetical protein
VVLLVGRANRRSSRSPSNQGPARRFFQATPLRGKNQARNRVADRFEKPDAYLPIYLLNDRSPAASNEMGHASVAQRAKEQESMSRLKTFPLHSEPAAHRPTRGDGLQPHARSSLSRRS